MSRLENLQRTDNRASDEKLLDVAAHEIKIRIRMDHDRAPDRLKPMLAHIDAHLFDRSLNVNSLKEACKIRDNSVAIHFHGAVGQPPHAYISACRIQTAKQLLAHTDLPVWKISDLLGFSSIQVFSRAFFRWVEIRPSRYRAQAKEDGAQLVAVPQLGAVPVSDDAGDFWRRAMNGKLRPREGAALVRQLAELYLLPASRE